MKKLLAFILCAAFLQAQTSSVVNNLTVTGSFVVSSGGVPSIVFFFQNSPSGTTAQRLAKNVSGSMWQNATTTDTTIPLFPVASAIKDARGSTIAAPGTTGNVGIVWAGQANLLFDSAGGTLGHYVCISTIAAPNSGIAADCGVTYPAGSSWVGTLANNVAANGVGTVNVFPAASLAPTGYASFYDAGVLQTQRTKIDCLGGITCPDDAGNTWTQIKLASQLIPPAGSAAAPAYSFLGQLDLGLYKINATTIGFSKGGVLSGIIGGSAADFAVIPTGIFAWCSDGTCSATDTNLSRPSAAKVCSDKTSLNDCQGTLGAAIVQPTGIAFGAGLPADPNGSVRYCSDCTIANPCAGGGTGAIAKRLNGAWVCN